MSPSGSNEAWGVSITPSGSLKASVDVDLSQTPGIGIEVKPGHVVLEDDGKMSIMSHSRVYATSRISVDHAYGLACEFASRCEELIWSLPYEVMDSSFNVVGVVGYNGESKGLDQSTFKRIPEGEQDA